MLHLFESSFCWSWSYVMRLLRINCTRRLLWNSRYKLNSQRFEFIIDRALVLWAVSRRSYLKLLRKFELKLNFFVGDSKPYCELCPRIDGAFKRTNVGRWVHVLCALYTPGVTFADTYALNRVSLFDVNTELFGSRACNVCENSLYARCGICIRCDAGMCKQYFHVTCAQKHGLLCETSYTDVEEKEAADPYYARCKAHSDRHQVMSNDF